MIRGLIFPSMVRTCTKCGEEKPLDAFPKSGQMKGDGRHSQCRGCRNIYYREYQSNPEVKKRKAEYNARRYEDPEIRKRQKENDRKPENRIRRAKYLAKWANTEQGKIWYRNWWKERYQIPKWNLNDRMAGAVRHSLRNGTGKNGASWESLVGYTVNDLKKHLEKKFKPGMSWKNMNEWHIDHIIPVAAFNFEKPLDQEFMDCWALNNLQPLWALENIAKGNKIPMNLGGRVSA